MAWMKGIDIHSVRDDDGFVGIDAVLALDLAPNLVGDGDDPTCGRLCHAVLLRGSSDPLVNPAMKLRCAICVGLHRSITEVCRHDITDRSISALNVNNI